MITTFLRFKKVLLRLILIVPPRFREGLIIIYLFFKYYPDIQKNRAKTKEILRIWKKQKPNLYQNSKKAVWTYCYREPKSESYALFLAAYHTQQIRCVRKHIPANLPYNEPILICPVKNDLDRVRMHIEHHQAIGIQNFVYLDNNSNDGTFEWLLSQKTDLYQVKANFNTFSKIAWIRQVTDIYGYNRWYLILDSDELFAYPGMETCPISYLMQFAEQERMPLFQSLLIDMYAKGKIINSTPDKNETSRHDIKKKYCYFDLDSYTFKPSYKNNKIVGGPRARIFSEENQPFKSLLTKNVLVYLRAEDFFYIHYLLPYYKNFTYPFMSGLLHYKFLPNDIQKYEQIARHGHYAGGSADYKQYLSILKENPNLTFFHSKSQTFFHSLDLLKINVIDKKYCNKFLSILQTEHADSRFSV